MSEEKQRSNPKGLQDADIEQRSRETSAAIQELKDLELLPLVLDIVEDVNSGKLLPKDVDNAAGSIRIRINKARETLRSIHGLSETPEERAARLARLNGNIADKQTILLRFRKSVAERIDLPDPPVPEEIKSIGVASNTDDIETNTKGEELTHDGAENLHTVPVKQEQEAIDTEMLDQDLPEAIQSDANLEDAFGLGDPGDPGDSKDPENFDNFII